MASSCSNYSTKRYTRCITFIMEDADIPKSNHVPIHPSVQFSMAIVKMFSLMDFPVLHNGKQALLQRAHNPPLNGLDFMNFICLRSCKELHTAAVSACWPCFQTRETYGVEQLHCWVGVKVQVENTPWICLFIWEDAWRVCLSLVRSSNLQLLWCISLLAWRHECSALFGGKK